jgi:excisionase family DNA binding protein
MNVMAKVDPRISELYTLAGAAEALGRNPSVITRAVNAGRLKTYPTIDGKTRLIRRSDLEAWKKELPGRPPKA